MKLCDDDARRSDADRLRLATLVLTGNTLNVDDPLTSVHAGDLAFGVCVFARGDQHLVVFADGKAAHVVLLSQFLRQGSRHDHTTLGRGRAEMGLSSLASLRTHTYKKTDDHDTREEANELFRGHVVSADLKHLS